MMDEIDSDDFGRISEILITRKSELERMIVAEKENSAPVELDQSRLGRLSRMDAMQVQAMSQETARRREVEVRKIDAALDRIKSVDYGYCLKCDEPVGKGRLALDPAAPLCIGCAGLAEKKR